MKYFDETDLELNSRSVYNGNIVYGKCYQAQLDAVKGYGVLNLTCSHLNESRCDKRFHRSKIRGQDSGCIL